jgi:hypothetical protein
MTRDATRQIEILLPTAPPGVEATSTTWSLDRPVEGVVVGLRSDYSWRSYYVILEVWENLLRADGADVRVLWTGDRAGTQGERTRADVEEWSRLVECGVVGLGN